MSTTTQPLTAEQLLQMPDDGYRYELIAGELKKMSSAGSEHGVIVVRVTRSLANYVAEDELGVVFGAETGFLLSRNPDTVRAPDVAFVGRERIPAEGIPKAFWLGAPDLAVEVVSPGDTIAEVDEKVSTWLNAGTVLVWVVNPKWCSVTVYRSATDIKTLTENEQLDGEEVLPGFRCRVGDLFVNS